MISSKRSRGEGTGSIVECWLVLRKTSEEPDEGDLIGKAKPVMRAPTLAKLHEIFVG